MVKERLTGAKCSRSVFADDVMLSNEEDRVAACLKIWIILGMNMSRPKIYSNRK